MAASKLSDLRTRFNELARTTLPPEALQPVLKLDAEVRLADLSFAVLRSLEQIQPIGLGNPPVQLAARGLRSVSSQRVGTEKKHLRFMVTDGTATHQALWWNCELPDLPAAFDLAFAPELSEYNGTLGIQLKVLDLKPI